MHECFTSETATANINMQLNENLAIQGKIQVAAITSKPNGNYIVTFIKSSSANLVEEHKKVLQQVLAPSRPEAIVTKDVP